MSFASRLFSHASPKADLTAAFLRDLLSQAATAMDTNGAVPTVLVRARFADFLRDQTPRLRETEACLTRLGDRLAPADDANAFNVEALVAIDALSDAALASHVQQQSADSLLTLIERCQTGPHESAVTAFVEAFMTTD